MIIQKVAFITLGCRLNQAEEERLRREFSEKGIFVVSPEKADLLVINSCSVTALADRKTYSVIKKAKKANPRQKIVVIGCGAKEPKDYPEVDFWISNKNKAKTLKILEGVFSLNKTQKGLQGPKSGRTRALIKIQDGCNNFCAYCIVPYLRGREVSVPAEEVINQAKKLEEMGYKELVLSGVNVGKYHSESRIKNKEFSTDLAGLTRLLLKETAFPRIRLSSINPQDVSNEMIDLWAKETRLCPHFHLSLQSGSSSVLKRMGRPYSAQFYYSLVKQITQKIPDIAITTDVIVGFHGETEEEFEETVEFVKRVKFAKLHVFRYSKRAGTRANSMENQISEEVKKIRSQKLLNIGKELQKSYQEGFLGKEVDVLFEEEKEGYWQGLTPNYLRVKYPSKEDLENQFRTIVLTKDYLRNP